MTVCSWFSKHLTQRCVAVSSTNVWMFGLRDVVSVSVLCCWKTWIFYTSQIFSHKLVKTYLKSCLCPLNSNSQSGKWFHPLLNLMTQNPFGSGVPGFLSTLSCFCTCYGGGDRQGLLLTSHGLSFIQEISSSYRWLFHAKTSPLPRLPQDAK